MDENLEKVTAHRASQAPCISKHTSHLKNILQTKKRAKRKFSVAHSIKIKRLEKEIEASCQEDLRIYEETVFETRYFSRIQKYLSCIRKSPPLPNEFLYKGNIEKTKSECANLFNSFFVSVFKQKDTNFQPNYPRKNLNWFKINQRRVETLLEDLKIGKSSGPDKFGNILLRNAAKGLSKSLILIFQTIINKGTYPNQWKFGQICPVKKDSDKKNVTCYRPINLLSCISKVLERIIFDEIYPLVQEKLHTKQFGFRKKRSATLQLLLFLDRTYKYNDDNEVENLSVLYLDFSKAFDTVPHSRLLDKVQNFGIGGKLRKLVHSYLSDRKQVVKVRNTLSTPLAVTSGVPQGSILGPLLFLMFINDLTERFAECFGYADDYKLIFTQQEELENGTKQLEEWCELNEMKLNEKKCSLLLIKGDLSAQLNNVSINQPSVQRDLGLFVENSLGRNKNCSRRSANALKDLFKIRRNVTKKCNIQNKIHAYTEYVMPMLTYASQAYHPSIGSLKKNLKKFRNKPQLGSMDTTSATNADLLKANCYRYPCT